MKTSTDQKRVLVVDDEPVIAEGLQALLECEQIESATALSQADAVGILEKGFYPVVITDLRLNSQAEGLALIDYMRETSPRSRIVVLSGYVTTEVEQNLLERGVACVMHKPADGDTILAAVQELLAEIERLAENDALSLEELYLSVRKRLYGIPRRRFNLSHDQAEDVIQEAWLLFMEKRGSIRAAGPWLAGTVANLSLQSLDQHRRKREIPEDESNLAGMEAHGSVNLEARLTIRQALDRVDERTRTLCSLIAMEGFSYEEVSDATGLPIGSIGPLYIRAKQRVLKELSH